ncbi:MAG: transcription antitermination factor NusB [Planctomycetaceae bacterium]
MSSRRSRAREAVLQVLYQHDLNPELADDVVLDQLRERLAHPELTRFAWSLYRGVLDGQAGLDGQIGDVATNWSLKRMAVTDRNVLRLGAHELARGDTPPAVVIDQAIELARKFGSANSAPFVNGILDRLVRRERPAPVITDTPAPPAADLASGAPGSEWPADVEATAPPATDEELPSLLSENDGFDEPS